MYLHIKRKLLSAILLAALGASVPAALAQTSGDVEQIGASIDGSAATSASRVESRMAGEFAALAGSEDDARALIQGLRNGTSVTFDGVEPITITMEGKTGYGNVFITLALAQASLKQAGITEPTLSDLAVALNGGTIDIDGTSTEFQGVLTMRAAGMGWGQIAKENGFRLGYVISALKSGKDRVVKAGTAAAKPVDLADVDALARLKLTPQSALESLEAMRGDIESIKSALS
jgi:hypothetical protein